MLLTACGSDEAENGGNGGAPVEVRFTMSTRASSGTGTPANPVEALQVERFNHYWVVFTDGTGKIVAIVNNTCNLTEMDEFTVKLSPGTYKVYGFANISDSYLEGLGITMGSTMPDLSATLFTPDDRFFGNSVTTLLPVETFQSDYESGNNLGIPMTSVDGKTVQITNAVTVASSVEVVRMFAKVEFVFSNNTSSDLTLRSQSVSNLSVNNAGVNGGFIPLYNDDMRTFTFLDEKPFKTLSHSYGTGLELAKDGDPVSRSFYVLESQADKLTNSFMLGFNVVKKGENPSEVIDYMRYGLTDETTLTAIRRNDWIRIPISFSDWQMRIEARTYPPIGGYPEAEIDENESNEFVVKFEGGGDFSIRPFIRKFGDDSGWFGIDNTAKISGTPAITISDPDNLFETAPALKSTGEILGKMKVLSGKTATITITVNVLTSPGVAKELERKIFVTQK